MHTPIKVLIERFNHESEEAREKYRHLMDIIGSNELLDEELFGLKREEYANSYCSDLSEIAEKYKRIAHHDSHTDQGHLREQLSAQITAHCEAFRAQYAAKNNQAVAG